MVSISPFQNLWGNGFSDTGDWCIPHRVRGRLTTRRGRRHLLGDVINLAASACHLRFRLQLREEAVMPQKIGGGCSSRKYYSSTCNGVEIGGVVAKK